MRPKDIGTAAESAVVAHLRENGWPDAERRALHGSTDLGDVAGCKAMVWEIKGGQAAKSASHTQIAAWLDETETERRNASADIGVLVVARAGYGVRRVGHWWAIVPLRVLCPEASVAIELTHDQVHMPLALMCQWLYSEGYGWGAGHEMR